MAQPWVVSEVTAGLTQVLKLLTGDAPKARADQSDVPGDGATWWWKQEIGKAPASLTLWIGAPETSWQAIGNGVLLVAGIEDAGIADIRSTYHEVVTQTVASVAESVSKRFRREAACGEGSESAPDPDGLVSYCIYLTLGGQEIPLFACFNEQSLKSFETSQTKREGSLPRKQIEGAAQPELPKSLDLLIDVELPVSVSFGRAQLPLRDVLKLTTGSIVELNRAVSEPVEIIVNNCVIAKGQVVVIEGNFGVRINQVISRQDRLRSIR